MKTHLVKLIIGLLAVTGFAAVDLSNDPQPKPPSPPAAPPTKEVTADDLGLVFDLQDGSRIVGRITPRNLPVVIRNDSIGEVKIPLERIREIQFVSSNQLVAVTLQNGDKLQGRLMQEAYKLLTAFGPVTIPTPVITRLSVTAPRAGRLPEGCVLWYSFDVDEGERTSDQSGRDHHGQVRGAEYVAAGKIGGAYRFARGEKQLWVADSPDWGLGEQPFTIALWVKLDAFPDQTSEAFIIGHDEGGGGLPKWGFEFFRDGLCFHVNGPQVRRDQRIVRQRFQPELNRWYHLAVSRDAQTFRLFVDGECVKTEENPVVIPAIRAELTIGQAEGLGINGLLDEVMLFKRALTAPEVAELAAGRK